MPGFPPTGGCAEMRIHAALLLISQTGLLMFGKLFGKKNEARRGDDHVWTSDAIRISGVSREVTNLCERSSSVLVVALDHKALESIAAALADREPERATDAFSREAVNAVLRERCKLTVALASVLQPGAKIDADHEVEILVYGRHPLRAQDDAICRFADAQGPRVRVTFHLALDDALLTKFAQGILPLLEKLGAPSDEAIVSGMLSRAIESAQAKNKS